MTHLYPRLPIVPHYTSTQPEDRQGLDHKPPPPNKSIEIHSLISFIIRKYCDKAQGRLRWNKEKVNPSPAIREKRTGIFERHKLYRMASSDSRLGCS